MTRRLEMNRRFLRSVNLGKDRKNKDGLSGYVVTPSVRNALARIQTAFVEDMTERAFTLTGPYGTGKSSFGLFLWHLLSDKKDDAWKMLGAVDRGLADSFRKAAWGRDQGKGKGTLVLTLTARCAPVAELLADAFDSAELNFSDELSRDIDALRSSRDTKRSMRLVQSCVARICKKGYSGVFFIFDEFGKIFEEARRESGRVDVFLLQELAEAASRSVSNRMFFMGILHQSIANYAAADATLRNEFSKIEGRFEPISFVEPVAAQIGLAAAAFPARNPFSGNTVAEKLIKGPVETEKLASLVGLKAPAFAEYCRRALPLHPMTLAALPLLFRRFGQNERSIFTFLTSNEAKGFQDFLRCSQGDSLFRLCDLFDYFFENYEAQLANRSFGHPFVEAHASIQAKASLTPIEVETIKTIAVLTSLGLQSPIHASEEFVGLALSPTKLADELAQLRERSILVYRKFNKTYALWNGSDINLDECCEQADRELKSEHFSIAQTFAKFLPPVPMVAKRHSVAKGALRYFETRYVDDPRDTVACRKPPMNGAAGAVVVCLADHAKLRNSFSTAAREFSKKDKSVIFAIPSEISDLTEGLQEIRRLNWVSMNVKELRDDHIATREVAVRLAAATQAVRHHQSGILDPRPARLGGGGCKYFWNGEEMPVSTFRDVSVLLSQVCDDLYPLAPIVKNELVNKRSISSQAAAARRVLINAMSSAETVSKERLGIEGYPPERSIYESVIALSNMHAKTDGGYVLRAPTPKAQTNLFPVWRRIEELVFAPSREPIVVKKLYEELSRPPYGVLEGLMPILLCAFYFVNRDEVSLYSEGTFVPDPQEAHFELLIRRPELFAISGMRITGMRKDIIERLANGLQTERKVLPVVRKLYAMMNSLSKYARETNSVSEQTQKFRQAFFDAKSPEKLLFYSLPESFGLGPIEEKRVGKDVFVGFFDKLNGSIRELAAALPKLVDDSRKLLLQSCGFEPTADGWKALYDRSSFLLARIGGSDICPFLQNVVNTAGDWDKADQVISYIQQTPMTKWGTSHINEFAKNARGVGDRFKAAARPFLHVQGVLSSRDQLRANEVVSGFKAAARKCRPEIVRAALLKYLSELDAQEAK